MSSRTRLERLQSLSHSKYQKNRVDQLMRLYMAAWGRGFILCKDGKERNLSEWVRKLPEYLQSVICDLVTQSKPEDSA